MVSPNNFVPSKIVWTDQTELDPSKTNWTNQNHFGPIEGQGMSPKLFQLAEFCLLIYHIAISLGSKMQIYPPVPPSSAYPAIEKHGATTNFRCLKHISQIKSPFVK